MPPRDGARDATACHHPAVADDGACALCGACAHDIVVNGVCYSCGSDEVVLTHKPRAGQTVVPAGRLTGPRH